MQVSFEPLPTSSLTASAQPASSTNGSGSAKSGKGGE
jgi:hypothetical protein